MKMQALSPERWQQVKTIFLAAVDLDAASRQQYLNSHCGADSDLLSIVEKMIEADAHASSLENPIAAFHVEHSWVGRRVGPYRVLEELGKGGMGSVYLARREDEFDQLVAIKIIRRGMDTDDMLRRFRNERQILAHLDHPNIARLLDGGTTDDGLPYFVMEHVPGVSIDKFCDKQKLSLAARLSLFRQVCAAVSYAHQHLAVHRDIKPSNILVTQEGAPKLVDFGIAKLLTPDSPAEQVTATAQQLMTPEYASPEQIDGKHNVTTSSDVYSLGVVLYELLTGHSPYHLDSRRPDELARVICEDEPERPSRVDSRPRTLNPKQETAGLDPRETSEVPGVRQFHTGNPKLLRGDLDNILLMALRKDPARRYSSVEQFSEDIRRHLEGLPVIARPDTLRYRTSKFVSRHRAASIGAVIVALTLLTGIAATWYQARVAKRERALAQRRFGEVRQLANSFLFKYHDAIEPLPGSTKVREMLVQDALAYLDNLSRESADDRSLQRELALAYLKVGDVQGKIYAANLGNTAGAIESYRKAVSLLETLAQNSADLQAQTDLRNAYQTLALTMGMSGDPSTGEYIEKALKLSEALVAAYPNDTKQQLMLARSYILVVNARGLPFEGRVGTYKKAQVILAQLAEKEPDNVEVLRSVAVVEQRLGDQYLREGTATRNLGQTDPSPLYQQAAEHHQKSREAVERLIKIDPDNNAHRRLEAIASNNLGEALLEIGESGRAVEEMKKALGYFTKNAVTDPANVNAKYELSLAEQSYCRALLRSGQIAAAIKEYSIATNLIEEVLTKDPRTREYLNVAVSLRDEAGDGMLALGRYAAALDHYRASRGYLEKLALLPPASTTLVASRSGEKFGDYYAALAQTTDSPAKRRSYWLEARNAYQSSLDATKDPAKRNQLDQKLAKSVKGSD